MQTYVNPMKGFTNSPYLLIQSPCPDLSSAVYNVTENCYWHQDKVTDFLFHSPPSRWIKVAEDHYQTPESEGFGGRVFPLNVNYDGKIVRVDLRGPWSGGSYCANQYLSEPSHEVSYEVSRFSRAAGYLTWKQIEEISPAGWSVMDTGKYGKHWPELVYQGVPKREWSKELLESLRDEFFERKVFDVLDVIRS